MAVPDPLQVLLVCGSPQQASANRRALDVVRAAVIASGHLAVDAVALGDLPPFDPEGLPSPAVVAWRDQLAAADTVVVATPEYAGGIAGTLKNALDWVVGSGEFYGRPVGVVSAGTNGGQHARRDLVRTLTWQGAHVVADLGIAAPRTKSDANGRYTDADTILAIEAVTATVLATPTMASDTRWAVVAAVVERAGVEPGHVAPVPGPPEGMA